MFYRLITIALLIQSFSAAANPAYSFSSQQVIIAPKNPGVISRFYGDMQYGIATLHWKLYEKNTGTTFIVERSENGVDFKELDSVASTDGINFQFKDTTPLPTGFYRVKNIGTDTVYTEIMRLSSISGLPQVKVSPVYFDAVINVELESKTNEVFNVVFTNSKGEVLSSRLVNAEKGVTKIVFDDSISFLYTDEYTMTVTGIQYSYIQKLYKK